MKAPSRDRFLCTHAGTAQRGLTLIELMVSIAITLIIVAALITLYLNVSRSKTAGSPCMSWKTTSRTPASGKTTCPSSTT
jgi:prepilin-type N-terminal cleavage/methylation domain-containing protein